MKIIEIACSISGDLDGIGKHARLVTEEFQKREDVEEIKLLSGNTAGFNKVQLIFSIEMYKALSEAISHIKEKKYDCVIVEYPFNEYNPIIIWKYIELKNICRKRHCLLALSLHEYDRVKELRKIVIRKFVRCSDFVYVSEPYYLKKLKKMNNSLFLRTIPNHIPVLYRKKADNSKENFVYFGFINSSKAFNEMIKAWDKFNVDKRFVLNIVTATKIDFDVVEHKNIKLYIGLDDEKASEIMWNSLYSIVPVLPYVGFNNSSFVSTLQCGCIPIGKFGDSLKEEKFLIQAKNYEVESLIEVFNYAINMSEQEMREKSSQALEFGKKFTVETTVDLMLSAIYEQKYNV